MKCFATKQIDGSLDKYTAFELMQIGCSSVAEYYVYGGVKRDYGRALPYFKKACDLGYADSCAEAGSAYYDGLGTEKDFKLAKRYNEKACEMQSSDGCFELGRMYSRGEGVPKNPAKAEELYGKACDLGDLMGCDYIKIPKILNEMGVVK